MGVRPVASSQATARVDAIEGIFTAFDRHSIVAVAEAHPVEQDKAFLLSLIARLEFAAKVNDIVVEFGNA